MRKEIVRVNADPELVKKYRALSKTISCRKYLQKLNKRSNSLWFAVLARGMELGFGELKKEVADFENGVE